MKSSCTVFADALPGGPGRWPEQTTTAAIAGRKLYGTRHSAILGAVGDSGAREQKTGVESYLVVLGHARFSARLLAAARIARRRSPTMTSSPSWRVDGMILKAVRGGF